MQALLGVGGLEGTVVSVPPSAVEAVHALGADVSSPAFGTGLAAALRRPGAVFGRGVLRWAETVPDLGQPGLWLPAEGPAGAGLADCAARGGNAQPVSAAMRSASTPRPSATLPP